ncbi:MAG: DEAD/DEAH box helicase [Patescibacteria group bacterium]
MLFKDLNLIPPLLQALGELGYQSPSPIQAQSIPFVLENKDLIAIAQTGTGKTAAFALPIIQKLISQPKVDGTKRKIRVLVLTPTRELATQINESFDDYAKYSHIKTKVVFGGVSQYGQVEILRKGLDVLVATPGRLIDLLNQGLVDLSNVQILVLDEADNMLDMGFIKEVKKIITKVPKKRQTLLFSATMPKAIEELADTILSNPAKVQVNPVSSTAEKVQQVVYFVDKPNKKNLLIEVLQDKKIQRVLVFTRTKHGADKVVKDLLKAGIQSAAIHGNKSQNARQKVLSQFKDSKIKALVATDIAARGIDIDELTHVINFELPNVPEQYVHRIGRTGRAGASGIAINFCDIEEKEYLQDIQKVIKKEIPVIEDHSYPMEIFTFEKKKREPRPPRASRLPKDLIEKPEPKESKTKDLKDARKPTQQQAKSQTKEMKKYQDYTMTQPSNHKKSNSKKRSFGSTRNGKRRSR